VSARSRLFNHLRIAVDHQTARDAALAQQVEKDAGPAADVEHPRAAAKDVRVGVVPRAALRLAVSA
jgi:hypothetical protein